MPSSQLILDTGPFRVGLQCAAPALRDTLGYFYHETVGDHDPDQVLDYDIRVFRRGGLRRLFRQQVLFEIDGMEVFEPQPAENAFPMFEWGLNWCIATSAHRYMMLHAGTVAFGDRALILPGTPGSGKSTLSAALHLRGARLLSDEFGLLRPESGELLPLPRAIPLKNTSIEAIIDFDPAAALGPTYPKTRKGRVRHLRPDAASLAQQRQPAMPRWLVFPRYEAGATLTMQTLDKTAAFRQLAFNCFNYKLLGEAAFRAVARMVREVEAYTLVFSRLDEATERLEQMVAAGAPAVGGGEGT